MAAAAKKNLKLFFDRPLEPIFMPKGDDDSTFAAEPEFVAPEYQNRIGVLANRFGGDQIQLKKIAQPNLGEALNLPKRSPFSLFIPAHQKCAAALIDLFLKVPANQLDDLVSTVAFARARVNAQLFNYALSVALLHRPDTRDVDLPNFMETFPSKFVDSSVFQTAREISSVIPRNIRRDPIVIPREYTASDLEEEHRVAYFREDIGINLHHWHWHLVYPFMSANRAVIAKDRRGELFYYMHEQVLARYNSERLCNMMARVKRFNNFREPISEGYYPKLDSLTSGRAWPVRQTNSSWSDLNRSIDQIRMNIDDVTQWKSRIENAINTGRVQMPDGSTTPLTIDTLGNMIEASQISPNESFYGNFHNAGHLFTAYVHDPDHKYLEMFGVMGDSGTAMRDPFFYRWHALVDDLFQRFKSSSLTPPYTRAQLVNQNITVQGISVTGTSKRNQFDTFWMESDVDMSRGLDFSDRGPVLLRFTHLNHKPFVYNIEVNNAGNAKMGTVRIFLAPKNDERGLPLRLAEQRLLYIELDRFVTNLPRGKTTIRRRSDESSVTIPFERTFRDLSNRPTDEAALSSFNFCGCGWPHHMLIPKGTTQGAKYELFVMISNIELDRITQSVDGVECADASSYCGIRDRLYPDRRDMGYPFDRPSQFGVIRDFIQTNMSLADVTIKFSEKIEQNPNNPKN